MTRELIREVNDDWADGYGSGIGTNFGPVIDYSQLGRTAARLQLSSLLT